MNFSEALDALKNGFQIKRAIWGGYWYLANNAVIEHTPIEIRETEPNSPEGKINGCQISRLILSSLKDSAGVAPAQPYQADLLAEDWQIVP